MFKNKLVWILIIGLGLSFNSCYIINEKKQERNLRPEDTEWLSEVRYIITSQERKIFSELPEAEREQFKKDFWVRRDPDPYTEENEYKEEYYSRIEQANKMFFSEGRPGWLTDRGRIFILFGPPTERHTYPMEASGNCQEVWYYGSFPVVFIDEHCSGSYTLSAINLAHLQDLNLAQAYFKQTITQERSVFDYDLKVAQRQRTVNGLRILLSFSMKYNQIWFEVLDNASLETELYLTMEIRDKNDQIVWSGQETVPLKLRDEEELKELENKKFNLEIEINLPDEKYSLPSPGKYWLYSTLKQRTEEQELKKVTEIRL
ncbi:MAG: GWxTD domain-containing protein [Acidobacteriota bacterium]|nr:GWxTD domain-containing protein [Acidobacteriota bacterium]MDW3229370.1 GWxTD domain-containing protein [Acidobacteriota bacterium]MDY0231532.1 GWxTD domain-containing protein [Candidatus Saccharicenans sp.]